MDVFLQQLKVLCQNGDTALFFQIVGIHDPFGHLLVFAEGARLSEHGVHQCGFAMVNVSDDSDVTKFHKIRQRLEFRPDQIGQILFGPSAQMRNDFTSGNTAHDGTGTVISAQAQPC